MIHTIVTNCISAPKLKLFKQHRVLYSAYSALFYYILFYDFWKKYKYLRMSEGLIFSHTFMGRQLQFWFEEL